MISTPNNQSRILVNPPSMDKFYNTWQFSQAVRVDATVWVAGQIGVDSRGRPGRDIEEQTRLCLQNLTTVLTEAGSSLADVVELVSYHISMDDLQTFVAVKSEFFPSNYPAWTAIGVTALALPELLVEVKAIAVVDSGISPT